MDPLPSPDESDMVCWQRQGEVGMTGKALNRDLAKDNPERAFSNPRDIVDEVLMTRGEKLDDPHQMAADGPRRTERVR